MTSGKGWFAEAGLRSLPDREPAECVLGQSPEAARSNPDGGLWTGCHTAPERATRMTLHPFPAAGEGRWARQGDFQ